MVETSKANCLTRIAFYVFGVVVAALLLMGFVGIRVQPTTSIPRGLYLRSASREASYVAFCPTGKWGHLSAVRGYREFGSCPDLRAPLVKRVVGRTGDRIGATIQGIAVNGHLLPNTAPLPWDSRGMLLEHYAFGDYTVKPDSLWVISDSPHGFDSRYFGPVKLTAVRERLKPLWTWQ